MKNVGNSSDGRSQGVPKISGHLCIGRMGALRGHLCDSTAFLSSIFTHFGDITALQHATFPYPLLFLLKFRGVPFGVDP